MSEPTPDQIEVMRFVDGEMHDVERTRFARRLEQEPELQQAVEELQGDRGWFGPERQQSVVAPPGLVDSVLQQLQEAPDDNAAERRSKGAQPQESLQATLGPAAEQQLHSTLQWTRQLLIAAAVVFAIAAAVFMGSMVQGDADQLEASPDRIRIEMEQLDERIREQGGNR